MPVFLPPLAAQFPLGAALQRSLSNPTLPIPPPPVPLLAQGETRDRPLELLGHRHYDQAFIDNLTVVSSYGAAKGIQRFEYLHQDAALALMKMSDAARADGVWIVPVSGFRDQERQRQLFEAQVQRQGSPQSAAQSVAPPGYSEHHTGYAVDLADGLARAKDISRRFVDTQAFEWLMAHGQDFGFELSFPEDNPQGIIFEPWHWRYVGSAHAQHLFEPQTLETTLPKPKPRWLTYSC
ncbi:MAG: M15 family metallopeptidase [Leptolyngbya sp. RL_3_1]|nr:M15 family metallopeptidase [Leptolyngbya sp. RL_3_1]